jgi:CBS domain containing-hemolysin-like protein
MITDILFAAFLVLLNGFFVAAEFAIVKVRSSQVELKANKGSSQAKIAKHILSHLDAYLSATQLGITLASLGLGWVGESVVASAVIMLFDKMGLVITAATAHSIAVPTAFILITICHIVLGEQAPKTLAIRYPLESTMIVAVPLRLFYLVLKPFIWMLNSLSILALKIVGIKPIHEQEIHTEEELRLILTESEEGGAIKQSEHDLIQNVFEFDDRFVKQIMVPSTKISAINVVMSMEQVIKKVVEENYSRMPVYKDNIDNIIGILHTKDLLQVLSNKDFTNLQQIIRPAYYIPPTKKINELLREFQTQHIQLAIITNEFGETAGLVTMEDIIEELVGEIQDEHDEEKPMVEKRSDTEFIVTAQSAIGDVNDVLPIALPESDHYNTVSGLVNFTFGRIPAVNEKKKFGGYEFTILKRFKHSVELVKLRVLDEQEAQTVG